MKVNQKTKQDWLFAKLAQTIILTNGGTCPDDKLGEWIPKFKTFLDNIGEKEVTPEALAEIAAREKYLMRGLLGIGRKKPKKKKKVPNKVVLKPVPEKKPKKKGS